MGAGPGAYPLHRYGRLSCKLLLTRRLGFDPLTAAAMSLGGAAIGAAFSPINPFQVGIAQKLAELPLLSGAAFRTVFLVAALGIWIWGTVRYARRNRVTPPHVDAPRRACDVECQRLLVAWLPASGKVQNILHIAALH